MAWVEAGADRPSEKQSEAPDTAKNRGECLGGDRAKDVMCEEIRCGDHAMNPAKKEQATRLEIRTAQPNNSPMQASVEALKFTVAEDSAPQL